jgi:iron-sulfur cluster assembly protein
MIRVTDQAARHLHSLLEAKGASPADKGLRLLVEKGGCAGFQYSMKVDEKHEGDLMVTHQGMMFMVDAGSVSFLNGCEIDYVDSLADSGFRIHNPNAVRSCGCGTSFEPATPAASTAPHASPEPEPATEPESCLTKS